MLTVCIVISALLSYSFGVSSVFRGSYKPSIYSRLVWLLIAINGLVGVSLLKNSTGTIALAIIFAVGSLLMLIGAWKYSIRVFGKTELYCSLLLLLSIVIWLIFDDPILNVAIGLTAHFIGAVPSLIQVARKPHVENILFWLFFAVASILAFLQSDKSSLNNFLFALYYAVFDSTMTVLAARQYLGRLPRSVIRDHSGDE
jgi:hypothetical protein